MKYKITQLFYICPRGHVRKNKPSDNYKKEWEFSYSMSKDTRLHDGYGYPLGRYKYIGPKDIDEGLYKKERNRIYQTYCSEEVYLEVTHGSTYRSLYKQKTPKKEKGTVYMYTIPKIFSIENKYKQFRL